jgi:hypothetical protein
VCVRVCACVCVRVCVCVCVCVWCQELRTEAGQLLDGPNKSDQQPRMRQPLHWLSLHGAPHGTCNDEYGDEHGVIANATRSTPMTHDVKQREMLDMRAHRQPTSFFCVT